MRRQSETRDAQGVRPSALGLGRSFVRWWHRGGVTPAFAVRRLAVVAFALAFAVAGTSLQAQVEASGTPRSLDGSPVDRGVLAARERAVDVFVRLQEPSVTEYVINEATRGAGRPSPNAQRGQARRIEVQQRNFRRQAERLGVELRGDMKAAANGLRVRATPGQIRQMRRMPQVRSIHTIELHEPLNADSVPWIGAPAVWGDATGDGVTIGVIDTGIDYFHASMGGSGDPADFEANDPTVVNQAFFPNDKVIGGFDFVGTNFDASDPDNNQPMPDDDPVDENFHGTHVSGTAAGFPTESVGSGVAPDALLYALKVFGESGSTDQTANAIERAVDPNQDGAVDDAVGVINMSLGSNFGDPEGVSTVASQNAAEAGVIVVSSAGNAGNVPYIVGTPAVARDAIAVAASVPGNRQRPNLVVTAPPEVAGEVVGVEGAGPVLLADALPISGNLVPGEPLLGCDRLRNRRAIRGNIALIIRGECAFNTKYLNAQQAGATAIVVFNNAGAPIVMGGLSEDIEIPGLMISQQDGEALNDAAADATVEALLELVPNDNLADTITGFSSRGPGAGGSTFKPDVAAPGQSIVSAGFGTGTGAITSSGTSMAAPHVAGLAAIMRELHPDLSSVEIKTLIMNSTETSYVDGTEGASIPFPITAQGTGVIRADRAASLTSYAMPGGVAFGRVNPSATEEVTRQIRLKNLADTARTFTVQHVPAQTLSGVEVGVLDDTPIELGPDGEATVEVQLQMQAVDAPADPGFFSQREVDGWFVFDDGVDTLRVGYHGVVDPASTMVARSGGRGAANVRNSGGATGIVQGFTLAAEGGAPLSDVQNSIGALGFRTVANRVEFGIATEQPWESMSALAFFIDVDTDFDDEVDFSLVAADLGVLQGVDPTGQVVTAIFPAEGDGSLLFFANADLNDRVAVLPFFRDGALGFLGEGQTAFNYTLEVLDRRNGTSDIQTGTIELADEVTLNPAAFVLDPGEEEQVAATTSGRVLWLFPNDEAQRQADVKQVR